MNTWAAPGVRCVCIDDGFRFGISVGGHRLPVRVPMLNEVLTIREVSVGRDGAIPGDPDKIYLSFWEIELRQTDGPLSGNVRFDARYFQPLVQRKTDISALTKLLAPVTVEA
jgi:hypothetical protein